MIDHWLRLGNRHVFHGKPFDEIAYSSLEYAFVTVTTSFNMLFFHATFYIQH